MESDFETQNGCAGLRLRQKIYTNYIVFLGINNIFIVKNILIIKKKFIYKIMFFSLFKTNHHRFAS